MRSSYAIGIIGCAVLIVGLAQAAFREYVTLVWDYPTAALSTNLQFLIYGSTNLDTPTTEWQLLTNTIGTNRSVSVRVQPGQWYFVATASNYWGVSRPSNVASTPAPPLDDVKLWIE